MTRADERHFRVVIAGSGFAGLGTAIRLTQQGMTDFVILERASDVGGVWRDNTYPGCACDVQSHLYSFSFAQNPSWSRAYSPQPEIWAYLQDCAKRFGLAPHLRFDTEVREARWDEKAQRWVIETSKGVYTADLFVGAVGALSAPRVPKLPGLESFEGKVMHSARWDHAYDLTGKTVAVVGTGASAIQFVPAIQPKVGKLHLFQRTAPWVLPRNDFHVPKRFQKLLEAVPMVRTATRGAIYGLREVLVLGMLYPQLMKVLQRLAERYMERVIPDPALRAKLTPGYTIGCKRILISDDYYPSLTQPNVEVVTSGITEIRPHAVVAADGTERMVDAILFGTGFEVTEMPMARHIRGRDGRTLAEVWNGSPRAHLGTTVSGFPNFFLLQGPNTGLGHNSVITMIESQIQHLLGALEYLDEAGFAAVEPSEDAQREFIEEVDRKMQGTVWTSGGCASWYLDATGRNSTLWPGSVGAFSRRVERFDPREYVAIARTSRAAPSARTAELRGVEVRGG